MHPKRSDLVSVQGLRAGSGAGARRRAVGSRERGGRLLRGLPGEGCWGGEGGSRRVERRQIC